MTPRERFEAAIAGQVVDRIPAVCRLDKWYHACEQAGQLPDELRHLSLDEVEGRMGFGRSARTARVFKTVLTTPISRRESRQGNDIITEWEMPAGSLRLVRRFGPGDEAAGLTPTIVEYPIKNLGDYTVYEEIIEHTKFIPDYDAYMQFDRTVGQAGLPMVILGAIPFHELLLRWTGYERGYMHLADRPDVVLQTVETANRTYRKMWQIVADSPARFVMHGVNFDTQMTSPPIFREHFLPYLREFNQLMHAAGKKTAFHADGDMSGLLDLAVEAGFDVADCFACNPLVPCTFAAARQVWRDRITIWGGLPSTLLEPTIPLERLERHLDDIYANIGNGRRFILGISDQAMPTSSWAHLAKTAQYAAEHAVPSHDPIG